MKAPAYADAPAGPEPNMVQGGQTKLKQDCHFCLAPKLVTDRPHAKRPLENLLYYSHICGNINCGGE